VETAAPKAQGFVAGTLISCFGLLAAVLALNIFVDPFAIAGTGIVPTAVENDRSTKLTLVEELRSSPEILILGSSRARQAEPAFLEDLTGHRGFNAGVTGGTAADAWAFTRFTASRFPGEKRHYLWFVDVGIAGIGVNPQLAADSRVARYLDRGRTRLGLRDLGTYLGPDATRASIRVIRKCVIGNCLPRLTYLPDGSIARPRLRHLPEHETGVEAAAAELAASVREHPFVDGPVDPARYTYFERTLAFMNSRGEQPVIVLNPIHPTVLAELERQGFAELGAAKRYLRSLHRRGFDFLLVNCGDIRTWGGQAEDFANATHVDRTNMRRLLRYVVASSDKTLL